MTVQITAVLPTLTESPSRDDPDHFDDEADALMSKLPVLQVTINLFGTQANALATEVNANAVATAAAAATAEAAAAAAMSTTGATTYVPDQAYDINESVIDPTNQRTYRKRTATSSSALYPNADATNWLDLVQVDSLPKAGGTMTGPIAMSDQLITAAVLKDVGMAFKDSLAVGALDYREGQRQRYAPATGAQALSISNWPPAGIWGELIIEGFKLGAATITLDVAAYFLKPDGTFALTTSLNTNHGATLSSTGIDFVAIWSRDGGVTRYAKVLR